MALNLRGRDFLTLRDFTPEEIVGLLDLAADYKKKKKRGKRVDTFKGKNIALIFEKTSTRTRCSFEVAAHDLGIGTTYLAEGSEKEKASPTPRAFLAACSTESNTAALSSQSWKRSQNTPTFPFGTA